MQSCSVVVLANIGSFLPWKDRLRFEELSTRFRHLPCKPIESADIRLKFGVKDDENYCYFEFQAGKMQKIRRLVLHDVGVTVDYYIQREVMIDKNNRKIVIPQHLVKMAASDYFDFSVYLFNKLISFFSIRRYSFPYPSKSTSEVLTDVFTKKRSFLSDKLSVFIDMERIVVQRFGVEAWNFLECLKDVHEVEIYNGPLILKPNEMERFRRLPFWRTAEEISLHFGHPLSFNWRMNFGIDDEFLQSLVDRKASFFTTNTTCSITSEFLLKYIKNCLSGAHALRYLEFPTSGTLISKSDIVALGFEVELSSTSYLAAVKAMDCRKGGHKPDQIEVELNMRHNFWITIIRRVKT